MNIFALLQLLEITICFGFITHDQIDDFSLMLHAVFVSVCQAACSCMGCDVILLAKSVSPDGRDKTEKKPLLLSNSKNVLSKHLWERKRKRLNDVVRNCLYFDMS